MRSRLFTILTLLLLFSSLAAQPKDANSAAKNSVANEKAARDLEAERILKERRANAQSLLLNLAADARNFKDQTLRARTQARIADALWGVDRERSRTMFRSAWDAAEVADAESQLRMQEEIKQQQAKTGCGGYVMASPPDLRREVLAFAAKRDRALGEEFLAKFKDQKAREAADLKNNRPNSIDEASSQRLSLARELVDAGDVERGLQFADPVLGSINMESVDFLAHLHEKDAAAADQRYAAMIAGARLNPQTDANTVSLLSSYIFTPHMYIVFNGNGTSSSTRGGSITPTNVSPELQATFLRFAAGILLRPLAPPGQDQSSSGPDGHYLVMKRLMPLFEQFAPPDMTTALKAQLEALSSIASNAARERDDEWLHRGITPEKKDLADREQSLLDQIDRAKTSAERDRLNLELANFLARRDDLRARDYVDKIDESELRKSSRAYIDAMMAMRAIEMKNPDRALEIARTGELTHFQKAWVFAQTAKLLAKTDRERARGLIEDSAGEARRMENSDPDRPRAFLALANVQAQVNRAGVWDVMGDVIKAANSAEQFSGEDGQITFSLVSKGMNSIHQNSSPDLDVAGVFSKLAEEDYDKAVELARGFEREGPRANAVIAIARSVLEEKKKN